jgi:hypothetical protein
MIFVVCQRTDAGACLCVCVCVCIAEGAHVPLYSASFLEGKVFKCNQVYILLNVDRTIAKKD